MPSIAVLYVKMLWNGILQYDCLNGSLNRQSIKILQSVDDTFRCEMAYTDSNSIPHLENRRHDLTFLSTHDKNPVSSVPSLEWYNFPSHHACSSRCTQYYAGFVLWFFFEIQIQSRWNSITDGTTQPIAQFFFLFERDNFTLAVHSRKDI